jgi:hypothetical protein
MLWEEKGEPGQLVSSGQQATGKGQREGDGDALAREHDRVLLRHPVDHRPGLGRAKELARGQAAVDLGQEVIELDKLLLGVLV